MGNVNAVVFDRFMAAYGRPKNTTDEEMFLDLYETALDGYDDAILEKAVFLVIDEHEFPTWPTIAQIKKACNKVIATDPRLRPHVSHWEPEGTPGKPDPQAKARVAALVKSATETIKKKAAGTQIEPPDFAKIFPNAHDWMKMLATTPNHELNGINLEQQEAIREAYGMNGTEREAAE